MAEFSAAGDDQAAVLKGLRLLLEKIEETQGLVGTDREVALDAVRELIKAQQQLRESTQATKLDEKSADPLVEKQTAIQKELARLPEMLGQVPAALTLVEQAKGAAYEATGKLFEAQREAALQEQGKVLGNLAAVEQQLMAAGPSNGQSITVPTNWERWSRIWSGRGRICKLPRLRTRPCKRRRRSKTLLKQPPPKSFRTRLPRFRSSGICPPALRARAFRKPPKMPATRPRPCTRSLAMKIASRPRWGKRPKAWNGLAPKLLPRWPTPNASNWPSASAN